MTGDGMDGMTEAPRRSVDRIVDPSYVENLQTMPIDELRRKKDECEALESEVSYARRLIQGRLDILRHGVERMAGGDRLGVTGRVRKTRPPCSPPEPRRGRLPTEGGNVFRVVSKAHFPRRNSRQKPTQGELGSGGYSAHIPAGRMSMPGGEEASPCRPMEFGGASAPCCS